MNTNNFKTLEAFSVFEKKWMKNDAIKQDLKPV
jgi:hypothetical protein